MSKSTLCARLTGNALRTIVLEILARASVQPRLQKVVPVLGRAAMSSVKFTTAVMRGHNANQEIANRQRAHRGVRFRLAQESRSTRSQSQTGKCLRVTPGENELPLEPRSLRLSDGCAQSKRSVG